jgi:uncharacterized protein involved in exopolysaccharide biosynthesis
VLSFCAPVVVLVTVATLLWPPVYRATAKVLVERVDDPEKAVLLGLYSNRNFERHDWIKSEAEIIESYPVAARVVRALDLDRSAQVLWWWPSAKKPPNELDRYMRAEKDRRFQEAVDGFLKDGLSVEVVTNSNVIRVGFEHADPETAAAVANAVVETYLSYRAEIYNEPGAYPFFDSQLDTVETRLHRFEDEQVRFKQAQDLLSPEAQKGILLTRLADFEKSLTETRIQRIGKEAKLAIVRQHVQNGDALAIPSTEVSNTLGSGTYIAKLREKFLDLEVQREALLQKFTPEYEEVVALDRQIAAARARMEAERDRVIQEETEAVRVLKAQEGVLQASIDITKREIRAFALKEAELSRHSRGIEETRNIYSMVLKQREEARISREKLERGVQVRVISPASIPLDPVRPRKRLNVAVALALGLVGGIGLAFLTEHFEASGGLRGGQKGGGGSPEGGPAQGAPTTV